MEKEVMILPRLQQPMESLRRIYSRNWNPLVLAQIFMRQANFPGRVRFIAEAIVVW